MGHRFWGPKAGTLVALERGAVLRVGPGADPLTFTLAQFGPPSIGDKTAVLTSPNRGRFG